MSAYVHVPMTPDEAAEYWPRQYNALADRYEESLAELTRLRDGLRRIAEEGSCVSGLGANTISHGAFCPYHLARALLSGGEPE